MFCQNYLLLILDVLGFALFVFVCVCVQALHRQETDVAATGRV